MAEVIDILSLVPPALNLRSRHLWLDYDEEADVLYISLRKPQHATDSEMEGRCIYHYDGQELVGVTVLQARASAKEQ
ncbi:MAG: DUF2283 domain-containing protein [Nitrospirae bacterium]|jgi:uncharacterized protein YuzE|nr:DUF2283 domain-containing protein [Nitrospirota bacterium]